MNGTDHKMERHTNTSLLLQRCFALVQQCFKLFGAVDLPLMISAKSNWSPALKKETGDPARKHGISEATLYNWRAKFGGMNVSEAKRLLADSMLDNTALKDLLSENSRSRRQA